MRDIEISIRIHNMDEIISKLQNMCPNFGRFSLIRDHLDIYFVTNTTQDLIIRKYKNNTGELIIFEEDCVNCITTRMFEKLGLSASMADEFINIFSQANGVMRTIQVKSRIYLHFLNIFAVMIDNIDDLGDFLTVQAMVTSEKETKDVINSITAKLKNILEILSVPPDDIVKESLLELVNEVNINN